MSKTAVFALSIDDRPSEEVNVENTVYRARGSIMYLPICVLEFESREDYLAGINRLAELAWDEHERNV